MPRPSLPLDLRLWRNVAGPWLAGVEEGDCWEWIGRWRSRYGYGRLRESGREGAQLVAHRVAYELTYGPIPEGLVARHRCDNPRCCNPAHIEPGTHRDNYLDSVRRSRCHPRFAHPSAVQTAAS